MIMEDELNQRHAYNNNSNTSQLKKRQDKTRQDKTKQDDIYIDSLHIMTATMTITMSMTIII